MKKNDSQECRNCHDFDFMDFSEQGRRSVVQHSTALAAGEKTVSIVIRVSRTDYRI